MINFLNNEILKILSLFLTLGVFLLPLIIYLLKHDIKLFRLYRSEINRLQLENSELKNKLEKLLKENKKIYNYLIKLQMKKLSNLQNNIMS